MNINELQRRYAEASATYETRLDQQQSRIRIVFEMIGVRRSRMDILDVGCSAGTIAEMAHVHRVSGVDISATYVEHAKRNGYRHAVVVNVDEDKLPWGDSAFNLVVCSECIEHLADTDWALSEINRVLPVGGELILTFPNISTPIGIAMLLLNRVPMFGAGYRSGHVKDFTTKTIMEVLKNNGFEIVVMRGAGFCVSPNPEGVLAWLARYLPRWSSVVVVHAVKKRNASYEIKVCTQPGKSL